MPEPATHHGFRAGGFISLWLGDKLTTEDEFTQNVGSWFTSDTQQLKVSALRARYARHRDALVLQDKYNARLAVYNQATATVGPNIQLPSDAVGEATIRGSFLRCARCHLAAG